MRAVFPALPLPARHARPGRVAVSHALPGPRPGLWPAGRERRMKQHLNTLFVTTHGAYLAREGEAVLVRIEKQTRLRVPIHTLGGIVCFGRIGVSASLMALCGE